MAKEGFNGQWIEVFQAGLQTDNKGNQHNIDKNFLEQVVVNYDDSQHISPAVIGHPEANKPAFGWVSKLRVNGDKLEAQFADTNDEFEEMVRNGSFKKRSASFYMDANTAPGKKSPSLRHVGFLGAQPPAIKGLRDIQFGEGESLTFEIQFNEGETMKDEEVDKVADSVWERFKIKLGIGDKKETQTQQANFSEADMQKMVTEAVTAATASFGEKVTALENENKTLRESMNKIATSGQRASIVAFAERLGKEKFPPAFEKMGVIDFMEKLSQMPDDVKVSVVSFAEGENGKTVETKEDSSMLSWFQNFLESMPSFIAFGEHFANITATANADAIVDPERMKKINAELNLDGGDKK